MKTSGSSSQWYDLLFFWTILEMLIAVGVPLARSSERGFLKSVQYRLSVKPRGKSMTAVWYRALPPLWSWGTFHPQGFGLWKLKGKGDALPIFAVLKLPFIQLDNCSLATYERRKTYKMSFQRCVVLPSKMFFRCPSEFSSQNQRNWFGTR